eukprot:s2862_g1.t1
MEGLGAKSDGELTEAMVGLKSSPGSQNGTGLLQTVIAMKVREIYEKITGKEGLNAFSVVLSSSSPDSRAAGVGSVKVAPKFAAGLTAVASESKLAMQAVQISSFTPTAARCKVLVVP